MSYTPGPWTKERTDTDDCFFIGADDGFYVATIHGDTHMEVQKANALLIAAAPDLLQVCEEALHWITHNNGHLFEVAKGSSGDKLVEALKNAITKAIHG